MNCHGGSLQEATDENRSRQGLLPELEEQGSKIGVGLRGLEFGAEGVGFRTLSGGEHPEAVAEDPRCARWSAGGFGQLRHGRRRTSPGGEGQVQRGSRVS